MKKIFFLSIAILILSVTSGQAQTSPANRQEYGVGLEALSEVLLGVRLGQRGQDTAFIADLGALPTQKGALFFYRLAARKYKGIFYGFLGFAQWLGATEAVFIDAGVGGEVRLGGLGLSLEVGPALPVLSQEDSDNTQAFISSLSLMYWF